MTITSIGYGDISAVQTEEYVRGAEIELFAVPTKILSVVSK